MKISNLKKKFKDEWVLAEVIKEDSLNRLVEVKPLTHAKNRSVVYEALTKVAPGKHVATIYTGQVPPKGMAFAFHAKFKIQSE